MCTLDLDTPSDRPAPLDMLCTGSRSHERHQSKAAGQTVLLDMGVYQTDRSGPLPALPKPVMGPGAEYVEAASVTTQTTTTSTLPRPRRPASVSARTKSGYVPSREKMMGNFAPTRPPFALPEARG